MTIADLEAAECAALNAWKSAARTEFAAAMATPYGMSTVTTHNRTVEACIIFGRAWAAAEAALLSARANEQPEPPSAIAPCTCALSMSGGEWSSTPDPRCPVHGAK